MSDRLPPDKAGLRAHALRRRAAVGPAARGALAHHLLTTGLSLVRRWADGRAIAVSLFLPIHDEPDARPLLAALAAKGLGTALPATPPRGQPLRFRAWRPGEPLVPGRFGTLEPGGDAPEVDPDLLVVPLSAFDRRGARLGYGAGYYDGALARLRRAKPVFALGLAFAVQEVDAVPTEPHDEGLDAALTDRGLITFGSRPCASSSSAT